MGRIEKKLGNRSVGEDAPYPSDVFLSFKMTQQLSRFAQLTAREVIAESNGVGVASITQVAHKLFSDIFSRCRHHCLVCSKLIVALHIFVIVGGNQALWETWRCDPKTELASAGGTKYLWMNLTTNHQQ